MRGRSLPARIVPLIVACLLALGGGDLRAQDGPSEDWQPTGLADPIVALFVQAGGGLVAKTDDRLLRSGDGGATWTRVGLPAGFPGDGQSETPVAVDPADSSVLYVGPHKSTDGGQSWSELGRLTDGRAGHVSAISPADPGVLYATLAGPPGRAVDVYRSRDGGSSWERIPDFAPLPYEGQAPGGSPCLWRRISVFPHPADAGRALFSGACEGAVSLPTGTAGRYERRMTWQSWGQGETRFEVMGPTGEWTLVRLVGGQRQTLERFYGISETPSRLFRSDDDGLTWSELAQPDPSGASWRALAYDPAEPDRLYAGRALFRDRGGQAFVTVDGGTTWLELGRQELAGLTGLVLSADRRSLYAATRGGLFRLGLPASS